MEDQQRLAARSKTEALVGGASFAAAAVSFGVLCVGGPVVWAGTAVGFAVGGSGFIIASQTDATSAHTLSMHHDTLTTLERFVVDSHVRK